MRRVVTAYVVLSPSGKVLSMTKLRKHICEDSPLRVVPATLTYFDGPGGGRFVSEQNRSWAKRGTKRVSG